MGPIPIFISSVAALALLVTGCQFTRAGYETAPYTLIRTDGRFQVRDYPALVVVETPMSGSRDGSDGSFNRLFRYITGSNAGEEKIAMTTPVFMEGGATNARMAFVMPASMNLQSIPRPSDPSVEVRELKPGQFAVYRFKGGRSSESERRAFATLTDWVRSEGLPSASDPQPVFAYFDPPWIPGFLRRNEVMLQLRPATP